MIDINPEYMVCAAMIAEAYRTVNLYTSPSLVIGYLKEKIAPKDNLETKIE
jgi:hypothetical protein